eukprot:14150396-Alexandrium_andersonii.AAC.1
MASWAALAARVLQAEFPACCIQSCFSIFVLGGAGGRKLYGEDSDQMGAFKSHIARLANYCKVDTAALEDQLHFARPAVEHAYKEMPNATHIDAW